jgi:hypothetical protein
MKTIFFEVKKEQKKPLDMSPISVILFLMLDDSEHTCLRNIIYDTKDYDFLSHLQTAGDVRQIFDSNNIERAAGKTKKKCIIAYDSTWANSPLAQHICAYKCRSISRRFIGPTMHNSLIDTYHVS